MKEKLSTEIFAFAGDMLSWSKQEGNNRNEVNFVGNSVVLTFNSKLLHCTHYNTYEQVK